MLRPATIALALVLSTACKGDHAHEGEGAHGHPHPGEDDELPGQSVTVWAERTELFAEFLPSSSVRRAASPRT
jgi:hypothetical protein